MKNLIQSSVRIIKNKLFQIFFLSMMSSYLLNQFFIYYSLQVPFVFYFRSPVVKKEYQPIKEVIRYKDVIVTATPTPKPKTDFEIIDSKKHSQILRKVYFLESTNGKNDGCKKDGKYNGFGYGQNTSVWNCFDSFEIVADKVDKWFDKYLSKGYTEAEALCLYNTGIRQPMCNYSITAQTL